MFIKDFAINIKNIQELKIAIALQKIYELKPNIASYYFSNFIKELLQEDCINEMTELQIQEEFLYYIQEIELEGRDSYVK